MSDNKQKAFEALFFLACGLADDDCHFASERHAKEILKDALGFIDDPIVALQAKRFYEDVFPPED